MRSSSLCLGRRLVSRLEKDSVKLFGWRALGTEQKKTSSVIASAPGDVDNPGKRMRSLGLALHTSAITPSKNSEHGEDSQTGVNASTTEGPLSSTESPPKKKRGRPPKAKKQAGEVPSETVGPADISNAFSSNVTAAFLRTRLSSKPKRKPQLPLFEEGMAMLNQTFPNLEDLEKTWFAECALEKLNPTSGDDPVGQCIEIPENILPEANASFFYDPMLTALQLRQRDFGSKGMIQHYDKFGRRSFMYRSTVHSILREVDSTLCAKEPSESFDGPETSSSSSSSSSSGASEGGVVEQSSSRRFYLDGWTGSGKTCAMYGLAAWARSRGWVVMYIPSAYIFVQGGRYFRRADQSESESEEEGPTSSPLWDTPEAAKHVMRAVKESHEASLRSIPTLDGQQTLLDVIEKGLSKDTSPQEIVEAAIAVKDGLLGYEGSEFQTMVLIDDYNVLYDQTEYLDPVHALYNRPILPDELPLASGFRILEASQPNGRGIAIASPTFGSGITPAIRLPLAPNTRTLRVPRFSAAETALFSAMMHSLKIVRTMPTEDIVRKALALTNGNAKELREWTQVLLGDGETIGLSLGYKAQAAKKKSISIPPLE